MIRRANIFLWVGAMVALQGLLPLSSLAAGEGDVAPRKADVAPRNRPTAQPGEDRWLASFAITSGITIQKHEGSADSFLFEDMSTTPTMLRESVDDHDQAVSPFVGGSLELMTPTFPIPTRPRLFLSAELLPTFASERDVALEGDPDCAKGPEPDVPCERDETEVRSQSFGEDSVNGLGTKVSAEVDTLVFGVSLGAAFPLEIAKRQLRIKPSFGWISYKVKAEGFLVDAECDPMTRCTTLPPQFPGAPPRVGHLRETTLSSSKSKRFHGIGPGLDVEMDVGRFGPFAASLFMGGRTYYIPGDRTISFFASQSFPAIPGSTLGADTHTADFEVEVDRWMYRAHLGMRFFWLGSQK